MEEVAAIKTNLTKKQNEIERIEYNLATAPNAKVQETCTKMLEKAESERDEIMSELKERDKSILNLNDYVSSGLNLKNNMLKLWELANLGNKRRLQNMVFPDGIVWSKENDDIEPVSRNEFIFTYGSNTDDYGEKENGQTADFSNLSALAPAELEKLNRIWRDFRKVVQFIDENKTWLLPALDSVMQKP